MKRHLGFWAASAVLSTLLLTGCGTQTPADPQPTPGADAPRLLAVDPAEIPADFAGDVSLIGVGFTQTSEVLIAGVPAAAVPGLSVQVNGDAEIIVHVTYNGPGSELISGPYDVQVREGNDTTAPQTLTVRPFLAAVEHLFTAPRGFTPGGGAFDVWTRPVDSDTEFMSGLDWSNFQIENLTVTRVIDQTPIGTNLYGVADVVFQPRDDESPLAVAIAIDQSGSLIGLGVNPVPSDPDDLRIDGAQMFVDAMGSKDQTAVVRFDCPCPGGARVVQDLTNDKDVLKAALDTLREDEGGNTPLYEAIGLSLDLVDAAPDQMAAKAVIVVTDGRNTEAGPTPAELVAKAQDLQIPVFTIGLGNPNDPASLDRDELELISMESGGRFFFAEDASALSSIFVALSSILEDSYRLEAALSFEPPLTQAGAYQITGDVVTRVDGRTITYDLEPFNVSLY